MLGSCGTKRETVCGKMCQRIWFYIRNRNDTCNAILGTDFDIGCSISYDMIYCGIKGQKETDRLNGKVGKRNGK